jgi:GMP synthase (glutamine-hydrolysing)
MQVMLSKLKGVSDPEAKRKLIGGEFIKVFQDFRDGLEKSINKKPKFLVQGTL